MRRILHIAAIIAAGLVATQAIAGDLCVDPESIACKLDQAERALHGALSKMNDTPATPVATSTPTPPATCNPGMFALPSGECIPYPPPPDPGSPGVTGTPGHRGPYQRFPTR